METYTIYDFYNFVEHVAVCFSLILGVILFFASFALVNYETTKSEKIFCIVIAFLFFTCLIFSIFMNYLQIR